MLIVEILSIPQFEVLVYDLVVKNIEIYLGESIIDTVKDAQEELIKANRVDLLENKKEWAVSGLDLMVDYFWGRSFNDAGFNGVHDCIKWLESVTGTAEPANPVPQWIKRKHILNSLTIFIF